MKVIELLKISRILLETLQNACIKASDVRFIQMYDEYIELFNDKHKMSYIAAYLSEKYKISERQFFYIIKRLSTDCNLLAM